MTEPRYLLDTSALLAHYRKETGWQRVQTFFEDEGAEVLTASLSLTEFARRLRDLGAPADEARDTVNAYLDLLDEIVPVDGQIAFAAFGLTCEVTPRLPLADALLRPPKCAPPDWCTAINTHGRSPHPSSSRPISRRSPTPERGQLDPLPAGHIAIRPDCARLLDPLESPACAGGAPAASPPVPT